MQTYLDKPGIIFFKIQKYRNTVFTFADLPDEGPVISKYMFLKIQKYSFHFADLPDEGPVISGSQPRYHTGDILTANCSSSRSLPAASLK